MLDAGADVNAHSVTGLDPDYAHYSGFIQTPLQAAAGIGDYTLVCMLLEHGADLNGPAHNNARYANTALQAICVWDPVRQEERLRKDKIIQLFLDKGVDVNAVNSAGHTALMRAAQLGDISTAFTLLKHGAKSNAIAIYDNEQHTALDIAAWYGRLDMVKFLLNANALSSTAWSKGQDYEGAIKMARKHGRLVISELIHKHSAERSTWNVPYGNAVETSLHLKQTHQSLSLRTKLATALWPQSGRHNENLPSTTVLDQTNDLSNGLEEGTFESSTAAPKAEAKGTPRAEMADVDWTSVIEEIGDETPSLAETGCDESRCTKNDETAGQTSSNTRQTTSGKGAWLYQPTDQSWVEDNQQSAALLCPSSLAEDVFMGCPGYPSV
ncbi:ankyrin repeat-containing domain protein, partial [Diaporthe sp. PMI_573]